MVDSRFLPSAALSLALAALGASARAAESLPEDAPVVASPLAQSLSGRYLAGRHAEAERDAAKAAELMSSVLAADPDNLDLARRALGLALASGRIAEANALAERIAARDQSASLAALTRAVALLRQDRNEDAVALFQGLPGGGSDAVLLPLIKAWVSAGAGDLAGALDRIAPLRDLKGLDAFHALHAGLLEDLAGEPAAAETHYRSALDLATRPSFRVYEIVGNFYLRQKRPADARALYERFAAEADGPGEGGALLAAVDGPEAPAPTVGSVRAGVAEALFGVATLLSRDEVKQRALMHAHLALALEPGLSIARVLIADVLASDGRDEEALAAYRGIDPQSPFGREARREAAEALARLGRIENAIAELRAMIAEGQGVTAAATSLGNILRAEKRFAEAAEAYDTAIAAIATVKPEHWLNFYYRGVARERNHQWDLAEPDFERALELQPDQPHALNYLAYSWVEQGRNFDRALTMLKKAVDQRPDDAYIVDSLGWVYQRLGQYDKAVEHLERAIELMPQDPVINDHLGDAYWRSGRRLEARFQWRRALYFKPEPDQVAPIEAKIEHGLGGGPSDS